MEKQCAIYGTCQKHIGGCNIMPCRAVVKKGFSLDEFITKADYLEKLERS